MSYIKLYESFGEYRMSEESDDYISLKNIIEDVFVDTKCRFQFNIEELFTINSIGKQVSSTYGVSVDISSVDVGNLPAAISHGLLNREREVNSNDILGEIELRTKYINEFNQTLTSLVNRLVKSGYVITYFNSQYYKCSLNILVRNEKIFIKK